MKKGTIPKWLKDELKKPPNERSFKQTSNIKTPALKAAYTQALKTNSFNAQEKALKSVFYEKSRYYANRIAQNEVMKAYNVERGRMLMNDDSIEVVSVVMSRTHPRKDICDYHSSVNKYGLGAGVYPKHLAPIAPFHPYCRCRIVEEITRSAKGAKFNHKADKEFMGKFNNYEKRLIIGSQKRVDSFLKSGDVMKSAVLGNPTYLRDVGGVKALGYNSSMKMFNKSNITKQEIKSVEVWTANSGEIKQYMWGLSDNEIAKSHALNLFGLFDKYKSNVTDKKVLYRGMSIPDELFKLMGYASLVKGSSYTPDSKAISSFSTSSKIAYEFAKDGVYSNKVVLKVESNGEEMFDITEISTVAKEEETILMRNIWYNVKHIKNYADGGVKWLLITLQKK